jgi:transaldolase
VNDPGVKSVTQIYTYYKKFGIETEVMGASFRNVDQILALAGCDLLTISPELLARLQASDAPVERVLDPATAQASCVHAVTYNEGQLPLCAERRSRWRARSSPKASARFAADAAKLDHMIAGL